MTFSERLSTLPPVVSAQEMQAVDAYTIGTLGLPGRVLMENAGRATFEVIRRRWQPLAGKHAAIFCGKGNNGGDGLVVARLLGEAGVKCETFLLGEPEDLRGDAAANYGLLTTLGHPIQVLRTGDRLPALAGSDFVIDALLGTGVRGPLSGLLADTVVHLNHSGRPIVAVDLPTGMNADTGAVAGPCIRASVTVTFGARKSGLLFSPGREHTGELVVADIGFPRRAYQQAHCRTYWLDPDAMPAWLPQRSPDAFKNRVGQILVIAGSAGFGGAARLAATAALRAGAGLVVLAAPLSLLPSLESATAEVIKLPLPEQEGRIAPGAFEMLRERLAWAGVVALGPGLGIAPATASLVRQILANYDKTVVLDADGLNVLADDPAALRSSRATLILTPHPGELRRLWPAAQNEHPLVAARQAAAAFGQIVVLKGAPTVIALPSQEVLINSTGNAGMATGGSGDVLTGVIAGLAGQGLEPERAAALGVFLHGRAGDLACARLGMWSMLAGDILAHLAPAFLETSSPRRA
ncbi:MAG: NAD(P)H-hydrate dehydratase [candidate division KSB1 bacterium]|nr:NAD(P)H-hydrate dehydratase [candidate division KSB1 bacterium]MDZ7275855.1 NAD(P)H-hydrate dehydratase [candidate division KSB1 bacterium]MDZ7287605.1 NAD(P)H-hydrate dehydratase [candidate division KSB1 bacterium]MDZ7306491.1 NAD(P)H-hydrate dehydratase [candidate division KSB1 bacterium]MDZ7350583.1 NAD(P)H-hydrate dehydratase [candidate division KSB1 bacterium]